MDFLSEFGLEHFYREHSDVHYIHDKTDIWVMHRRRNGALEQAGGPTNRSGTTQYHRGGAKRAETWRGSV